MGQRTLTATVTASEAPRAESYGRAKPLGESVRTYIDAMREGFSVGRRYEVFRGRGMSHDQSITHAFAEIGGRS